MEIYYKNSKNQVIYFDRFPYYILEGTSLFDTDREYTSTGNTIKSVIFHGDIKQKDIDIAVCGQSRQEHDVNINQLINALEIDVISMEPGELHVGDYYLKCYFYSSKKPKRYINIQKSVVSFNMVIGKSLWTKETRCEYLWHQTTDTAGRGYPYSYDYDYTMGNGNIATIQNTHFATCNFVLKISGYVKNPAVTIGNHIYRVNEVVQKNEILTIDTRNKTITLTKNNGVQVNVFSKRDNSSYPFEPIPAGEQRLYWNSNYNLEITLYEERSEPLWT